MPKIFSILTENGCIKQEPTRPYNLQQTTFLFLYSSSFACSAVLLSRVKSHGVFSYFYCQVVLAEEELVVIDLSDPRWRPLRLPYLVSVHASAITTTQLVDNVAANVYDNIVAAGQFYLSTFTYCLFALECNRTLNLQ